MKTYRNDKLGFEIDVPEEWSGSKFSASHTLSGDSIDFQCQYFEAFSLTIVSLQIGPLESEDSFEQTENAFRSYTQANNYSSLEFGRFTVEGKEHIWARYYMGGGKWSKKYLLVLFGIQYAITATCFYQNMLLEREQVWDAVVSSFHLTTQANTTSSSENVSVAKDPPEIVSERTQSSSASVTQAKAASEKMSARRQSKSESETQAKASPGMVSERTQSSDVSRKHPGVSETQKTTLAFSLISYTLIVTFALIYIHFKVGFAVLFTLTNEARVPLSNFEYNVLWVILLFGIGAFVCLMYLIGVADNTQWVNNDSTLFGFIDRTMQIHDRQKETAGGFIFSDYTRRPHNLIDALHLQVSALLHALTKIFLIPFCIVQLNLVMMVAFALGLFLPKFILGRSLPFTWDAIYFFSLFFFCYRAFLLETAKRKGVSRFGPTKRNHLISLSPSMASAIKPAPDNGVTPEFIEKILSQESVINAMKADLTRTSQIGYKEVWRLGLITPDLDRYDPRPSQLTRRERVKKVVGDYNFRLNLDEQLPVTQTAVLYNPVYFNFQFNNLVITKLNDRFPISGYTRATTHHLSTEIEPGEFIDIRNIQMDIHSASAQNRSWLLPRFLQEAGFPLKDTYVDGDPLTTERGGTIVIDKGQVKIIYPKYFIQRRLIDDNGNLVDIGLDENFGLRSMFEVKMRPAVSDLLFRYVSAYGYIPVLRYRSFLFASEFMLPILDTPVSDSGWAELFINPSGKARLFIAKQKTLAEWYEMMKKLKQLFNRALTGTDYHFLGLTKDHTHLNQYFAEKQEILADYYVIQNWSLF